MPSDKQIPQFNQLSRTEWEAVVRKSIAIQRFNSTKISTTHQLHDKWQLGSAHIILKTSFGTCQFLIFGIDE
jgi:hypothetical protein